MKKITLFMILLLALLQGCSDISSHRQQSDLSVGEGNDGLDSMNAVETDEILVDEAESSPPSEGLHIAAFSDDEDLPQSAWQEIYLDYLNSSQELNDESHQDDDFYLIFLDSDDVPELYNASYIYANRSFLFMISKGELQLHTMSGLSLFSYIPYSGLYSISNRHMEFGKDYIGLVENGVKSTLEMGNWYDSDWEEKSEYQWNGQTVTKEEYQNLRGQSFDYEKAISPSPGIKKPGYPQAYSLSQMKSYLTSSLEQRTDFETLRQSDGYAVKKAEKAEAAIDDYLSSKKYLSYEEFFPDNDSEIELRFYYHVMDIDSDGVNELILKYEYEIPYLVIFGYDEQSNGLIELDEYSYSEFYYSDEYSSVVYSQRFGGGYFYRVNKDHLKCIMTVGAEPDIESPDYSFVYFVDDGRGKQYISKEKFDAYMKTVYHPEFIPLDPF